MSQLAKYESLFKDLIKDNEQYIVFYNNKAIKNNINSDILDLSCSDIFDPFDVCNVKRSQAEENIIKETPFSTCIHINKGVDLKVIFINDTKVASNIIFDVNENTTSTVYAMYLNVNEEYKTVVDIALERKAIFNYTSIQLCKKELSEITNAYLGNDAELYYNSLLTNSSQVSNNFNTFLYGKNACVYVNNSIINTTGFLQEYNFKVYHWNEFTNSELINYAICKNNSILNINSDGIIKQGCSESVINQKSKGIILDLHSSIFANPNLEIDEYDVIANHGASIGAIDDNDLYYLMSRGLSKEESERLIVIAYINPMIQTIKDELIKNYIEKALKKIIY